MTRLVRAELAKLRTTRLVYGIAAAMTAFAILTVVANGDHLSQLGGVLVAGAYALALALVGTRFVVRRDVT